MKKILIVDDDATILNLLCQLFKKHFEVYASVGVSEALWIVEIVNLDAICSDFNMRDGTGMGLLETVRRKNKGIPFLLMSGGEEDFLIRMTRYYNAELYCKTDQELIKKIISLVK